MDRTISSKPTIEELQASIKENGVEKTAEMLSKPRAEETQELSLTQQVTALTSMSKAIKEQLDMKRKELFNEMAQEYETTGSDRRTAKVNGMQIGTVSLTKTTTEWEIEDEHKLLEYLKEYPQYIVEKYECIDAEGLYKQLHENYIEQRTTSDFFYSYFEIRQSFSKAFEKSLKPVEDVVYNEETGEVVTGLKPCERKIKNITVRTEPIDKLCRALAISPSSEIGYMLGA